MLISIIIAVFASFTYGLCIIFIIKNNQFTQKLALYQKKTMFNAIFR